MWRDIWAPSLAQGVRHMGGLSLKPIIAKALQMGGELHNRPNAASALFAGAMAVPMIEAGVAKADLISTLGYITGHDLLFLGLAMASAKSAADPANGVKYSTVVTAMARNGYEFGIRVSGLEGEWFTAPAPMAEGLYLPGYGEADEGWIWAIRPSPKTVGWGGFVLGGAPGILSLVGGTPEEALSFSREMRNITVGLSPDYRIPALGFEGTAVGIDIRKVVQTGILPIIDTAVAHKDPGHPHHRRGAGQTANGVLHQGPQTLRRQVRCWVGWHIMLTEFAVLPNRYFDSVFLMRVAKRLTGEPGIAQAAVVMGTPKNLQVLADAGYSGTDALGASSNDLVVSLQADSRERALAVLDSIDGWLQRDSGQAGASAVRTLDQALELQPGSNLAVISVPGEYAAREARQVLERGTERVSVQRQRAHR